LTFAFQNQPPPSFLGPWGGHGPPGPLFSFSAVPLRTLSTVGICHTLFPFFFNSVFWVKNQTHPFSPCGRKSVRLPFLSLPRVFFGFFSQGSSFRTYGRRGGGVFFTGVLMPKTVGPGFVTIWPPPFFLGVPQHTHGFPLPFFPKSKKQTLSQLFCLVPPRWGWVPRSPPFFLCLGR